MSSNSAGAPRARTVDRAAKPRWRCTPRRDTRRTTFFVQQLRGRATASVGTRQRHIYVTITRGAKRDESPPCEGKQARGNRCVRQPAVGYSGRFGAPRNARLITANVANSLNAGDGFGHLFRCAGSLKCGHKPDILVTQNASIP